MTCSEYIKLLKQAKIDSVEQRWLPRKNGVYTDSVDKCAFCLIAIKLVGKESHWLFCPVCPLHSKYAEFGCGEEFYTYHDDPTPEKAQAIIDIINAVDVEAWANRLAKQGYVK